MSVESTDINFVLSGGSNNLNPDLALGGDPSFAQIASSELNNLFGDVTADQALAGYVDYKCVYIFNDHNTDTLYNAKIFIDSEVGGSRIELGVPEQSEIQKIVISGTASGGSFTLTYQESTESYSDIVIQYYGDLETWRAEVESTINGCSSFENQAVVTVTQYASTTIFTVTVDANRFLEPLELKSNDLYGVTSIKILKTQNGAPLNSIASTIYSTLSAPPGVTFAEYMEDDAITMSEFKSGYGIPIWIKRTILAGTAAIASDGFVLKITGDEY